MSPSRVALCGWIGLCVLAACSGHDGSAGDKSAGATDAGTHGDDGFNSPGGSASQGGTHTKVDAGTMSTVPMVSGLLALRIEPAAQTISEDGSEPFSTTAFHAIGKFADGERDITDMVSWSLDDVELGTVDGGAFTGAGVGGETMVRAHASSADANADLTVTLDVQSALGDAPDGIVDLFAADPGSDTVVDDDSLRIIYPSNETMFPRNLQRVDHQWRADASLDRFEVRFESDLAHIRLYTSDKHLLPDLQTWRWLANTHAGRSLQMTVRGASSAAPGTILQSKPITLYYSRSEVPGALYYWSTGAQGVLKATISSDVATKFFTDPEGSDTTCVSCHTVSRNGQRLSGAYGGEKLRVITVPDRELLQPSDPKAMARDYGWGTFSPDASRLLFASKGLLTMLDVDTGESPFAVKLPTGYFATHPDWAPDGHFIAAAYGKVKIDNKNAQGTSIARIPVGDDGSLGDPEVLRASAGMSDTMYFPSYSPDSALIAFVQATGKSKDNVTAKLFLLPAGGGDPIALTRLNERVRQEDGVVDQGNSMPTWAPSTKPDIFWIAFSSVRAYGDVLPDGGRDQLWAAAIDPAKIGSGEDPSYAAFWLPFQDQSQGNHRAFWAIDTETQCPSTTEICDHLDNDCDGIVDEDCCMPSDEVCDGQDNNCDGVVDEGCCVPTPEVCDGMDNNCNLAVDEGCGCAPDDSCGNKLDDDCDGNVDENCVY